MPVGAIVFLQKEEGRRKKEEGRINNSNGFSD